MSIHLRLIWAMLLGWFLLSNKLDLAAASFPEAHLTAVVHDVRVASPNAGPATASRGDILRGDSVRTGRDSRAEITFRDGGVARFGDNTRAELQANRTLELSSGALLSQVPEGVGRTQVKAGPIAATATGTTLLVEHLPDSYIKMILLEGTSRLCLKAPGRLTDCILLRAGQMLIANPSAQSLPDPVDIDLDRLLKTCHLLTDFGHLAKYDSLVQAALKQRRSKSHGAFVDTNLVIFGRGTLVTQVDGKASAPSVEQPRPRASQAKPSPTSTASATP